MYPEGTTDTAFVTSIYTNLFNRAPDADGLAYWVAKLTATETVPAEMTRDVMIEAMKNGATGTDATIIANKATVGLYYADKGLEGTNFSLASVTEVASTVTAAQAAADSLVTGQTFVLTNSNNQTTGGLDNVTGTDGVDTIIGSADTSNSTFALGDSIDGGKGIDRLYVTLNASSDSVDVANVEQLDIRAVAASTFDASAVTGTGLTFNSYKSKAALTVDDVRSLSSTIASTDNTQNYYVDFVASAVGGAEDAITLKLSEVGSKATYGATGAFYTTNIETINIVSEGSQKNWLKDVGSDDDTTVGTLAGTSTLSKLVVSGAQDLAINDVLNASITTIDASAATGGLAVSLGTATVTLKGGSGNDKFDMNATLDTGDTIDGGAGTDTLVVDMDIASTYSKVTNVEVIGLDATAGNRAIDMSKIASATTLKIVTQATGNTVTVTNAGTDYLVSADVDDDISITSKTVNATATLTLDNGDATTAGAGIDLTQTGAGATNGQVIDNVKVLTVNSIGGKLIADTADKVDGYDENSISALSGSQLETLKVTGDTDIEITTTDSGIKTVDASAHTGNVQVSIITATDTTITMGAGKDKVTLGTGKSSVNMGAGDDILAMDDANLTSNDTLNGGDGTDTLMFSAAADFSTIALAANLTNVSNFEKVAMADGTALTLADAAVGKLTSTGTLTIVGDSTNDFSVNASAVNSSTTTIVMDGSKSTSAATNYTAGLTIDDYTGGSAADALTIGNHLYIGASDKFNGGAGADTATIEVDGGASSAARINITAAQLETIKGIETITIDDTSASTYIGAVLSNTFVDNNASGNELNFKALAAGTNLVSIDASAVTSTVTLNLTGGAGNDTIKGGAGNDVITGGAGVDTVDLSAGGTDKVVSTFATSESETITGFTAYGTGSTGVTGYDYFVFDEDTGFGDGTFTEALVGGIEVVAANFQMVDGSTASADIDAKAITVIKGEGYADFNAMVSGNTAGDDAANALVMFYNTSSQRTELWFTTDADNSGADEFLVAAFTDITLAGIANITANNFFVLE